MQTDFHESIPCSVCKGHIGQLWELLAFHVHWTPTPKNLQLASPSPPSPPRQQDVYRQRQRYHYARRRG